MNQGTNIIPASTHRNILRLNSSFQALQFNPWSRASVSEQMERLDAERSAMGTAGSRDSLPELDGLSISPTNQISNNQNHHDFFGLPFQTSPNSTSPQQLTSSTETWIIQQQQHDHHHNSSSEEDSAIPTSMKTKIPSPSKKNRSTSTIQEKEIFITEEQEPVFYQKSIDTQMEEGEEEPISLFQGFRASHPYLAMRKSNPTPFPNKPRAKIPLPIISEHFVSSSTLASSDPASATTSLRGAGSVAGTSTTRFSKLPNRARHQAVAINNIAHLFSTLLDDREKLMLEADEIEHEKTQKTQELQQIEDILTAYQTKKRVTIDTINELIKREDRIISNLDEIDGRISSIGDQTVKIERRVRDIKGDSAILVSAGDRNHEQEAKNSCVKTFFGHTDSVEAIDVESPFGFLVSASADKTIRLWDLSTNTCLGILGSGLGGHEGWVRSVQMNSYNVCSGSGDKTAKLWDISRLILPETGTRLVDAEDNEEPLIRTFFGHTGGVTCLQFRESSLVTGSTDKTIKHWDLETGQTISTLYSYTTSTSFTSTSNSDIGGGGITGSTFTEVLSSPEYAGGWDERVIGDVSSTLGLDNEMENKDPSNNEQQPKINHGGHVADLCFWDRALAAGYGDGIIRLFDLRSGQCHRTLLGHQGAVTSVNFDDVNFQIISGSHDKTVKIWDVRMGQVLQTMLAAGNIVDLSWDHSRIAVACGSKAILMFSRIAGDDGFELVGHTKVVRSVKLIGGRLFSGSLDQTVKVWTL